MSSPISLKASNNFRNQFFKTSRPSWSLQSRQKHPVADLNIFGTINFHRSLSCVWGIRLLITGTYWPEVFAMYWLSLLRHDIDITITYEFASWKIDFIRSWSFVYLQLLHSMLDFTLWYWSSMLVYVFFTSNSSVHLK